MDDIGTDDTIPVSLCSLFNLIRIYLLFQIYRMVVSRLLLCESIGVKSILVFKFS